jgi:nicotinamidase-related amidase
MKPAFVVIDMQRHFLDEAPSLFPDLAGCVRSINEMSEFFRARGLAVIFVQDNDSVGPDDPGFELVKGLVAKTCDLRINKIFCNAFQGPALSAALATSGSDFALIAGFEAGSCVLATQKGADELGLPNALLRGAVLGRQEQTVAQVEQECPLVSSEEAKKTC